jgi:hypothetical protein
LLDELDAYREAYDSLTFQQHREMYERIGEVYPEQSWWDAPAVTEFINKYSPLEIVEVGGHDGGLAAAVLPDAEYVLWWLNLELVHCAQVCRDVRYEFRLLQDLHGLTGIDADALILSHTVEHLSETILRELVATLNVDAVYVNAPLHEAARSSWRGTVTAHVLSWSMQELDALFIEHGYAVAHSAHAQGAGGGLIRWYERA